MKQRTSLTALNNAFAFFGQSDSQYVVSSTTSRASSLLPSLNYANTSAPLITPSRKLSGVTTVSLSRLSDAGVKGIVLDLDKTLRPYPLFSFFKPSPEIPKRVKDWLHQAKVLGFQLYIISNNLNKHDVDKTAHQLQIPAVSRALKPFAFWHMKRALRQMGVKKNETILIGDKPFADGFFGRFNGIKTILVQPL